MYYERLSRSFKKKTVGDSVFHKDRLIMALKSKYPGLTEKEYMEKWDYVDVENAVKFAKLDKEELNYIFEKKHNLGDVV